jgi:hypothetical protein
MPRHDDVAAEMSIVSVEARYSGALFGRQERLEGRPTMGVQMIGNMIPAVGVHSGVHYAIPEQG